MTGDEFDLEDLPSFLTGNGLRVIKDGDTYFLEAARLESLNTHVAVHDEARILVPIINGIGRARSNSYEPINLGTTICEQTPTGTKGHAVVTAGSIRSRGKVGAVVIKGGAPTVAPPSPEAKWSAAALTDPDVSDALTLWGHSHDWVILYKVYEIIRDRSDILQQGWATKVETSRFTHTANHPQGAGDVARHSRSNQDPPTNPMNLQEAEAWLAALLVNWLNAIT